VGDFEVLLVTDVPARSNRPNGDMVLLLVALIPTPLKFSQNARSSDPLALVRVPYTSHSVALKTAYRSYTAISCPRGQLFKM
jgi:hypothetical protein